MVWPQNGEQVQGRAAKKTKQQPLYCYKLELSSGWLIFQLLKTWLHVNGNTDRKRTEPNYNSSVPFDSIRTELQLSFWKCTRIEPNRAQTDLLKTMSNRIDPNSHNFFENEIEPSETLANFLKDSWIQSNLKWKMIDSIVIDLNK